MTIFDGTQKESFFLFKEEEEEKDWAPLRRGLQKEGGGGEGRYGTYVHVGLNPFTSLSSMLPPPFVIDVAYVQRERRRGRGTDNDDGNDRKLTAINDSAAPLGLGGVDCDGGGGTKMNVAT